MPTTNRPFFANFFAAFRAHSALQKASPAITSSSTSSSGTLTTAASSAAATSTGHSYIQAQAQLSASSSGPHTIATATPPHQKSAHSTSVSASAAVATAAANAAQPHFRAARPLHAPTGTPHNRTHSTSPLPPSRSPDPYGYSGSSPGQSSPFGTSRTPSQTRPASSSPPPGPNPQFPYSAPYGPPQQRPRRGSDTSDKSGHSGSAGAGMWGGPEKWYIGGRTATGEERFYKLGLVRKYDSADRLSVDRLSL